MLADGSGAYVHRMVRAGEIRQGMDCFVALPGYITPPVRWGTPGLWEKKETWVLVHHCVRAYIHSLTVNGHCHICYVLSYVAKNDYLTISGYLISTQYLLDQLNQNGVLIGEWRNNRT